MTNQPKKVIPAIQKVAAFRSLNRSLELLECAYSMIDTAKLLYPDMDPKNYDKIYKIATHITQTVPIHRNLEF